MYCCQAFDVTLATDKISSGVAVSYCNYHSVSHLGTSGDMRFVLSVIDLFESGDIVTFRASLRFPFRTEYNILEEKSSFIRSWNNFHFSLFVYI